jgi:hypothetical protein
MRGLRIATLFPLATVAAGDDANAIALVRRSRARGLAAAMVTVNRTDDLVDADIYLLGGTGRAAAGALAGLLAEAGFVERFAAGRAVLVAVDAGLDAVAREWVDPQGAVRPGLGLLAATVSAGPATAGTVVTEPNRSLGLPELVGWVQHDVRTVRDPGIEPLARLEVPARGGLPEELRDDGACTDRIIATRLHGPVLALNPELADLVLARAVGAPADQWEPLPDPPTDRARTARIAEVRAAGMRAARRPPRLLRGR